MPALTPLPETSTSATSSWLPSLDRLATTKSPENASPYADCSAISACQGSGRSGSTPWARSRSRRSTSIDSPSVPCTPSRDRDRHSASIIAAMIPRMRTAPPRPGLSGEYSVATQVIRTAITPRTPTNHRSGRKSPATTTTGAKAA